MLCIVELAAFATGSPGTVDLAEYVKGRLGTTELADPAKDMYAR